MKWNLLLSTAALLCSSVKAIFSDDAFHVDYHQALLGIPQSHTTFFHKPQSSSNASLLYTISDKGVLGAINPRDGSLVWRQFLSDKFVEDAEETFLVGGEADGRITSGYLSTVSSWDALDGRMNWKYNLASNSVVKGICAVQKIGQAAENIIQDVVVVTSPAGQGSTASVIRIAGEGSSTRWEYQEKNVGQDHQFALALSPKHVYFITKSSGLLSSGKVKVVVIDVANGKEVKQYTMSVDAEGLAPGGSMALASGSESPFLATSEKPYKSIKIHILGSGKSSSIDLDHKGEDIQKVRLIQAAGANTAPHFLVHVQSKSRHWAEVYHIKASNGEVTKAYSLPATAEISTFAATTVGLATYFTRITDTEVLFYSSASHGQLARWPRSIKGSETFPTSLHAVAEVSTRGANGYALRVALSSTSSGWSMIRNGEQAWSRPEFLAYITKAIWSDDAIPAALAHEIEVEAASNPMSAYVHRLTRHITDLKHLPRYLINAPNAIFKSGDDAAKSTREKLVGSKLVLAATSRGEIIALDATRAGAVRWAAQVVDSGSGQDTSVAHLCVQDGRLAVYYKDGRYAAIDVVTGRILENQTTNGPFDRLVELPGNPAAALVTISSAGKPEIFSELAPPAPVEGSVLVTINDKGEAIGWSVGASIEQIWTLKPVAGAQIISVMGRSLQDPVSSIGQVLGDRSVRYKYINPNTAFVSALSSTALTVYLINAVTGAVLHTAMHEGVLSHMPISVAASGHKFTYTFTTRDPITSGLSTQIVVSELFESDVPNDRGLLLAKANYSSFSPDAGGKPFVESKSFTIAEPLSHLTISQTTQGITSRQILGYLKESQSIVGIPGDALNARRPVNRDPTQTEMEEGLVRYNPILDLDPKFFLSHSREVQGIEEIMTAPTLLESTSLVFAFGHDIFGTQVAPSNTFDVLGKGFKRIQLILTVVALYMGVLAIRPIARKKIVERGWVG